MSKQPDVPVEAMPAPCPACGQTRRAPLWPWLALAALVALLDQASKAWVLATLAYAERVTVLPFFDLTLLYNPGAAFSFLADAGGWQRWFFTALAVAAAAFIVWLLHSQRERHPCRVKLALAAILGGATGNLIDRSIHGHVVDFLLFYGQDWHFPAFNVADTAISCGAVLWLVDEVLRGRQR